jgi:hypothetical protein
MWNTQIHCVGRMQTFNIYKSSSYLTGNKLRLRYKAQPVNAVWGNSRCLFWEPYGTHKYNVWAECRVLIYTSPVRTSQETHYVSTTTPNRLMLFGETVAVYCEKHTEHTDTLCGQNGVWGSSRCLLWETYGTHRYTVWAECSFSMLKQVVY